MRKSFVWVLVVLLSALLVTVFSLSGCTAETTTTVAETTTTVAETTTTVAETTTTVAETEEVSELPMKGMVVGSLSGSLRDAARVLWTYYLKEGVLAAGAEDFINIDSELDVTKQVSDGEDILGMGIDILVMNPNDADAMIPIVEKANEMGIPVVCIDRATNGGEVVCTTGLDNWQIGEEAAKLMVEHLDGKGKVLMIQGTLGASVVFERGESFRQGIKNYPDIKLVGEPASEYWLAEDGLSFTEDALSAHPDLKAIYCHTDTITEGAVSAVEAAGKLDQVIFYSQGWYGELPNIMKEGKATIYDWAVNPIAIGKATADVCIKIAKGEFDIIPKKIAIPNQLITPETVDKYWDTFNLNNIDISQIKL